MALRKAAPERFAALIAAPFQSPDPLEMVELLVKHYSASGEAPAPLKKLEFTNSCAMLRKYAAYALGQLGWESSIETLERIREFDPRPAIREAARASLLAIREAPADRGHTEEERLVLIEAAYGEPCNEEDSILRRVELGILALMQSSESEKARRSLEILELTEKLFESDPKTDEPLAFMATGLALYELEKIHECIAPLEAALELYEASGTLAPPFNHAIRRRLGIAWVMAGSAHGHDAERRALFHLQRADLEPGDPAFDLMKKLKK